MAGLEPQSDNGTGLLPRQHKGRAPDKMVGREIHSKEMGGMGHSKSTLKMYRVSINFGNPCFFPFV